MISEGNTAASKSHTLQDTKYFYFRPDARLASGIRSWIERLWFVSATHLYEPLYFTLGKSEDLLKLFVSECWLWTKIVLLDALPCPFVIMQCPSAFPVAVIIVVVIDPPFVLTVIEFTIHMFHNCGKDLILLLEPFFCVD